MTTRPVSLDCGAVLSELAWLRGLARGLGADAHLAEDLTQATFLAALQHPPEARRPVRGWLSTVLRNLLRQSDRSRIRRVVREARAARAEAVGGTIDVLERAAVQKRVVDAVMALDEPYRTTVLLRFFEGLPPRRIAARVGAPVATVKTRLARALEQLRGRLDQEHGGDRRAWLFCLLAPLPQVAVKTTVIGAVIMEAKVKVAVAAAVVLLGVAGWVAVDQLGSDRRGAAEPAAESGADEQPMGGEPAGRGAGNVTPIVGKPYSEPATPASTSGTTGSSTSAAAANEAASAAIKQIRGRVIDAHSMPVASVRVIFRHDARKDGPPESMPQPDAPSAVSNTDGVFEMEAPLRAGRLEAQSPRHATVLAGTFDPRATGVEPIIIVAPVVKIAGHVVDEGRRPLPAARVAVELPQDFRASFRQVLDYSMRQGFEVRTDRDGAFSIESAPDVAGAVITAHLEGYEDHTDPLSGGSASGLEIVLRKTRAMRDTITGMVVDHAGVGLPGARVSTKDRTTRTDDGGRFTIKVDEKAPKAWLMALKDGFLPATLTIDSATPPDQAVVLRLEGSPLSIAGRVVDGEGKPLAGIRVWTPDTTLFASTREDGIQFVENLLSGSTRRQFWVTVQSDDDGRFVLRGLMPREYRLQAMDPKTLALEEAGPVKAGSTGVVITLAGGDMHETVAGVVVSLTGSPVPNVTVKPQRDTFTFSVDEGGSSTAHADTEACVTGQDGRFTLRNLPRKGVYLRLEGADILPLEFGRGEGLEAAAKGQDLGRLRVEVSVRCHFQVDLGAEPDLADQISMLDDKDRRILIDSFEGRGRLTRELVPIEAGRTSVLAAPQNGRTILFLKNGKEVARKTVRLTPGAVTTVRP